MILLSSKLSKKIVSLKKKIQICRLKKCHDKGFYISDIKCSLTHASTCHVSGDVQVSSPHLQRFFNEKQLKFDSVLYYYFILVDRTSNALCCLNFFGTAFGHFCNNNNDNNKL